MNAFVDRIAADLVQKEIDLNQTVIIVPSERMINYLQRALFLVDGKPKISPKIITIDRWIQQLSGKNVINKSVALFELYKIFRKDPATKTNSFDSFLNWGQILLSDFDEIDRYLVNPKDLFRNLKDVKDLESWSFSGDKLSEKQIEFMAFWEKLGPYYFAFENLLKEKNLITKGKAYRLVEDDLLRLIDPKQHFVIAGFNALSLAELSIFKQLKSLGRTIFYFDNDAFYLNDNMHEAGYFQRRILKYLDFKTPEDTLDYLSTKEMLIDVVECAQSTDQAAVIGSELSKMTSDDLNSTLLLLADEIQLKAMLHNLPLTIGKANITLGLPLKSTALRTFVDLIFSMQEGVLRNGNSAIYHRNLDNFIHHPFLDATLPKNEQIKLNTIHAEAIRKNWHFVTINKLAESKTAYELIGHLVKYWNNDWKLALESIQELNYYLDQHFNDKNEYEQTIIRSFMSSVQSMINLFEKVELPEMTLATFKRLFELHWSTENVAYYGNPLDGIQIMGLLETRGLDFKNVIALGMNEGAMPPTNPIQTLIPMDLRRHFNMPVPRDKQGLFAHHFYRLLHNAERLLVTYTTSSEDMGNAEPSRFLKQIELELLRKNKNINYNFYQVTTSNKEKIGETIIHKSPEIIERISELISTGLSFSKITKFLTCPLDFYYQVVLKLDEEDKVEESLESSTQGSILHYVMENLLVDYVERIENGVSRGHVPVTIDRIKEMKDKVPLLVEAGFKEYFSDDPETWQKGTNFVQYEMIKKSVIAVLNREIAILEENPDKSLFILDLEKEVNTSLNLNVNGKEQKVHFKGIIDRVDRLGGQLRILDYKSGKIDGAKVSTGNSKTTNSADFIIKSLKSSSKTHALQLLLYAYMYQEVTQRPIDNVGIISFITHKASPYFVERELDLESTKQLLVEVFNKIFEEIFDTNEPFKHNPNSSYCTYCSNVKKK